MLGGFYDLTLRCVEASQGVHHVRTLLSRTHQEPVAAVDADAAALGRAMERRHIAAEVLPGAAPGTWRVRGTKKILGKVSIIVPTCASAGHIGTCLNTIRAKTAYRNFEIICADNIPDAKAHWKRFVRDNSDKVVAMPKDFNWSLFNNLAANVADGEYLLFLNDDVEVIDSDWLDAMLDDAARPEVGVVGARLLYPNRSVQHAGMFLGLERGGRHAFRHANENDPGYFGFALTRREVIAVTGACMMMRRDVFEQLGRFEEAHNVINNDLDLCLRAHEAGLLTIYTPYATLIHHEKASREMMGEEFDRGLFDSRWATLFAAGDPYYNPGLLRHRDDYQVDDEPLEASFIGRTPIRHSDVKNILIVKLDHIGDFMTGLPAIRRLKAEFPSARIALLAPPASGALVHLEPAIDEFISFEFFHARSQQGERHLADDELDRLAALLTPYQFDLAVDFRKHLETRHILRFTGARVLAGYDSADRFPWLDIALELRADESLKPKRQHISEELLNLVAAISAAYRPETMTVSTPPRPLDVAEMPDHIRHLFVRPVVAIHAGVGNVNRQWPESHFVALIDLLIERNGVAVLLIGGKDDADLSSSITRSVARPTLVASAAGEVALQDLPRLLASAVLFIGNDSGPKHLAAAIDLPTIGIHSGVVDPKGWGPMGERSVAVHRKMACAPCYLNADDCPRAMACLRMLEPARVHELAEALLAMPVSVPQTPKRRERFELSAKPN
jgi:ADP-heptose:LPS heptosyltransferase/GT2 family glycosyltransferase